MGGHWYGYGWESQLLETGFLAAAASPLGLTRHPPPSWLPVVGFRWLLFRIMLGSGLIKLRQSSSPCWRCWRPGQASCMEYFYETQPVPSPLARRLHFMPPWFHSGSTYTNHVVERARSQRDLPVPSAPAGDVLVHEAHVMQKERARINRSVV